jgi:hypothetical protein
MWWSRNGPRYRRPGSRWALRSLFSSLRRALPSRRGSWRDLIAKRSPFRDQRWLPASHVLVAPEVPAVPDAFLVRPPVPRHASPSIRVIGSPYSVPEALPGFRVTAVTRAVTGASLTGLRSLQKRESTHVSDGAGSTYTEVRPRGFETLTSASGGLLSASTCTDTRASTRICDALRRPVGGLRRVGVLPEGGLPGPGGAPAELRFGAAPGAEDASPQLSGQTSQGVC